MSPMVDVVEIKYTISKFWTYDHKTFEENFPIRTPKLSILNKITLYLFHKVFQLSNFSNMSTNSWSKVFKYFKSSQMFMTRYLVVSFLKVLISRNDMVS